MTRHVGCASIWPVTIRFIIVALPLALLLAAGAMVWDRLPGDLPLARAIQEVDAAPWESTMEFVSYIGMWAPMMGFTGHLLGLFLLRRQWAEVAVTGGALLSFGVNPLLKIIVDRPRPTDDLIAVLQSHDGLSFPSGHAFTAVVIMGLLFYLAPRLLSWRWAVTVVRAASLVMILLTGLSRVYLGAHWPSDVLGGLLFGGITLALLIHLHRFQSRSKVREARQRPQQGYSQTD